MYKYSIFYMSFFLPCNLPGVRDTVKLKDEDLCPVCKIAVQYLDSLLGQNATEKEIEQALDKVCAFLPDTYEKEVTAISSS